MTDQSSYSEDEWFLISSLPSMIGASIASSEKSGVVGTMKEVMANMRAVMEGAKAYGDNALIQAIVARPATKEEAKARQKQYQEKAMARIQENQIKSPEQLSAQTVTDIEMVNGLLTRASATESAEYKAWVMEIGRKVAEAAKEGGFLGMGGTQVSDGEIAMLTSFEDAFAREGVDSDSNDTGSLDNLIEDGWSVE